MKARAFERPTTLPSRAGELQVPAAAGMTPVAVVIDVFGGIRPTARAIGVAPSTVLRWGTSTRGGRIPGTVPHPYLRRLLDAALAMDKRLTLPELVWGRPGIVRRVFTFESRRVLSPSPAPIGALGSKARELARRAR